MLSISFEAHFRHFSSTFKAFSRNGIDYYVMCNESISHTFEAPTNNFSSNYQNVFFCGTIDFSSTFKAFSRKCISYYVMCNGPAVMKKFSSTFEVFSKDGIDYYLMCHLLYLSLF
jgi:GH43 family beta-xylosidase